MKFPNYIYKRILESLIVYLYKNDAVLLLNFFSKYNNNQVIDLALVSKSWLKIVQNILPNQVSLENINILSKLIENKYDKINNKKEEKQKNNLKLIQLIKLKENTKRIIEFDEAELKSENKQIIQLNIKKSIDFLKSIDLYSNNKRFLLNISKKNFKENFSNNSNNKIKGISINTNDFEIEDIEFLLNTNIKQIDYKISYGGKELFFDFKFKKSKHSNIKILNLFKNQSINVTKSSHIKKFNFESIQIKNILNIKANDTDLENRNIEFNLIIDKLSLDSTLYHFSFYHTSGQCKNICLCDQKILDNNIVFKGIGQLLSNSKSINSVQLLSFLQLDFSIINGLKLSKSIKNISIYTSSFLDIVQNVLPFNRHIRNIEVNHSYIENEMEIKQICDGLLLLKDLIKLKKIENNFIDIYLITIICSSFKFFEIVDLFKSFEFPIREVFIINEISNTDIYEIEECPTFYQIKSNNTFINVYCNIK